MANLVNKEALVEAIKNGEVTSVDDILDEFKSLLKEFYQTSRTNRDNRTFRLQ